MLQGRYTMLLLALLCQATHTIADGTDATAAAREDLAKRLNVSPAQISVLSATLNDVPGAPHSCARMGADVAESMNKGAALVLIVDGQKHYYYAAEGETYRYCELPSTKKRGPVRPPDS